MRRSPLSLMSMLRSLPSPMLMLRSQLSLIFMRRFQLRLMLMSRFPLSLTSILSPLPPQLLLMLLPLLMSDTPELMLLPPLPTDMPELLPLLPTDMLLTNLRMLSTACYFYRDRLYKVHLSEWSGVWHQSAKTKSDNEK